jgi:hypothetical protein
MRFPNDGTGTFPFNQYGELMIQGSSYGSTYNKGIRFLTWDGSINPAEITLRIMETGNVGIGTINPDMKLTVKGNIHAEEVKIDLSVPAPDYVFKEEYNLKSIQEVEIFIKINDHLPEIPSAKELDENGIM